MVKWLNFRAFASLNKRAWRALSTHTLTFILSGECWLGINSISDERLPTPNTLATTFSDTSSIFLARSRCTDTCKWKNFPFRVNFSAWEGVMFIEIHHIPRQKFPSRNAKTRVTSRPAKSKRAGMASRILTVVCVLALATGCARRMLLVVDSIPRGAEVYGNTYYGRTPVKKAYRPSKEERQQGFGSLEPITLRWASGAQKTYTDTQFPLDQGRRQTLIFQRPIDAPGEASDMQYGLLLEQQQELRRLRKMILFSM